jgi:predicted nuclease of restriction endonuclease-like (RecB) superfamily
LTDLHPTVPATTIVDEVALFERIAAIIENRKYRAAAHVNQETTLMFWEIGRYINQTVLGNQRAAYGKKILSELAAKLVEQYGNNFAERNLYRMILFAERFSDAEILPPLAAKLSWSHFVELLPIKNDEARLYYATNAAAFGYGTKELRRQISRKGFERREIANAEMGESSTVPFNMFKDPYLLDMFGLKDNYLEADLEKAILDDIRVFFLEFGHGFAFIDSQKRMIVDGEDAVLDLLFYHREIKRLVAVELKLGRFKAAYMGQMLLYLKWLDKYERKEGEEAPIGIILCASANREKVELLEMDKAGIAVAEYWTHLPPKAEFETRIKAIIAEANERLERRKSLPDSEARRMVDFFLDQKGDEDE